MKSAICRSFGITLLLAGALAQAQGPEPAPAPQPAWPAPLGPADARELLLSGEPAPAADAWEALLLSEPAPAPAPQPAQAPAPPAWPAPAAPSAPLAPQRAEAPAAAQLPALAARPLPAAPPARPAPQRAASPAAAQLPALAVQPLPAAPPAPLAPQRAASPAAAQLPALAVQPLPAAPAAPPAPQRAEAPAAAQLPALAARPLPAAPPAPLAPQRAASPATAQLPALAVQPLPAAPPAPLAPQRAEAPATAQLPALAVQPLPAAPPAPPAPQRAESPAAAQLPALPAQPLPAAPPAPPAPLAPQRAESPAAAQLPALAVQPLPAALPAPAAPPAVDVWDPLLTGQLTLEQEEKIDQAIEKARDAAQLAQEKMATIDQDKLQEAMEKADVLQSQKEKLAGMKPFNFNFDLNVPFAAQVVRPFKRATGPNSTDSLYNRGRRELDQHNWDQAAATFTEVAGRAGVHADGALYWKAYALNKLGHRDEALAAIAELRKSYAGSRWLEDANALEVEVKQASGSSVAPEGQDDDEIKLLALNGLMQTDPDRAYPHLEILLKSANSPHLKDQALFVLAQSNSPKAQQLLVQIARGGPSGPGNPDLQMTAIRYLSAINRRQGANNQVLFEIYNSSNDIPVKREILNALAGARDKDHLLQIARTEKTPELRLDAIRRLGGMGSQAGTADALAEIYGSDPDKDVKLEVINALAGQRNTKALVDLGRKEKDLNLKKDIVRRVMDMNTPEAKAFLEDLLK